MKITRIQPNSLRGFPADWGEIEIFPGGAIVFGGNGTGKSSIVDSIECLIAGGSSLFPDPQQGVNWSLGSTHVLSESVDASCTIVSDAGVEAEIVLGQDVPAVAEDWVAVGREANFVLRRHMLLLFIIARPADRYQALSSFLDLRRYTTIENQLSQNVALCKADIDSASEAISDAERKLRNAFDLGPAEEVAEQALVTGVENAATILGLISEESAKDLASIAEKAAEAVAEEGVSKELETLAGFKAKLADLDLPSALLVKLESSVEAGTELAKITFEEIQLYMAAAISAAIPLIEKYLPSSCPTCEADIQPDQLLERLRERLVETQEIVEAKATYTAAATGLHTAIEKMANDYASFIDSLGILANEDELESYRETRSTLSAIEASISAEPSIDALRSIKSQIGELVSSHKALSEFLDQNIAALGGSERWNALQSVILRSALLISEFHTITNVQSVQVGLATQLTIAETLSTHATNARKQAVTDLLNDVTDIANNFYEAIHPGEGLANSRLEVRSATDGSVKLSCEFNGTSENPLLHFSESHLDTLGLCYFLAIRRSQANKNPIFRLMVLDDVMHSVDADHRRRVAEVLRREFSDHQVVITTHDEYFSRNLREVFGGGIFKQHRITDWSLQRGPILGDSATDIERIVDPDVRVTKSAVELSAAAGRFLEMLTKRLTERLQVNVIAKFESKHTIGDLWPQLKAKLNKNAAFSAANGDLPDRIDGDTWMRNEIGAHDNEAPIPPSDVEVRRLAEALAELYAATHCDDCGGYITRQTSGDWKCHCGKITYAR